jgi:hypothetical protein
MIEAFWLLYIMCGTGVSAGFIEAHMEKTDVSLFVLVVGFLFILLVWPAFFFKAVTDKVIR